MRGDVPGDEGAPDEGPGFGVRPVASSGAQSPHGVAPGTRRPPAFGVQPAVSPDVAPPPAAETPPAVEAATVRVDVVETPEDLVVLAELPGYSEDEVVLEGMNQQVRITAERADDYGEERLHVRERPLRVERLVALPTPVDIESADATFEDGVCRIEFPKSEQTRSHRIGFH